MNKIFIVNVEMEGYGSSGTYVEVFNTREKAQKHLDKIKPMYNEDYEFEIICKEVK